MLSKLTNLRRASFISTAQRAFSNNAYYLGLDKKYVSNNYVSQPIALERAERCYVWDADGRKYLDFLAGIACANQGHSHPKIVQAIVDQAGKIAQPSRVFSNVHMGEFSKQICELLGYDQFCPSNGGVEACESAVKLARRWGYEVKGVEDNKANVLMANNNFWGRSICAAGGCDDPLRYRAFGPYGDGFPLVPYNDVPAIEEYLKHDPNCVAVMLEPIQGEAGVVVPDKGYLKKVQELCKKYNVLFIVDEVQIGFGRSGKMMGYNWDLGDDGRPDIVSMGKAISGGYTPVSGICAMKEVMDLIKPGEHGSTFGGNPLGMAIARAAVGVLVEENMTENSYKMGEIFRARLREEKGHLVKDVRGRGLFTGVEFDLENSMINSIDFESLARDNGLLCRIARKHCVRFSPPLILTEEEVHQGADLAIQSLRDLEELNEKRKS